MIRRPRGVPTRAELVDHDALHGLPTGTLGRWWTWNPRAGERVTAGAFLTLLHGTREVQTSHADAKWRAPRTSNGYRWRAELRA